MLPLFRKFQHVISGKRQGSVQAAGTTIQLKATLNKNYYLFSDFLTYFFVVSAVEFEL